jgi:hypothetical protein
MWSGHTNMGCWLTASVSHDRRRQPVMFPVGVTRLHVTVRRPTTSPVRAIASDAAHQSHINTPAWSTYNTCMHCLAPWGCVHRCIARRQRSLACISATNGLLQHTPHRIEAILPHQAASRCLIKLCIGHTQPQQRACLWQMW